MKRQRTLIDEDTGDERPPNSSTAAVEDLPLSAPHPSQNSLHKLYLCQPQGCSHDNPSLDSPPAIRILCILHLEKGLKKTYYGGQKLCQNCSLKFKKDRSSPYH
ncbi:hypothetical protein K7X08_010488 [Anisodus acutangulus]|uniref:Uncharacterized protein n=1 Tax=Anisodus acutangulus TaxID=402998 RepID=A0A9Q1N190_9SOLA|nr:hypothetical protein K7X08_010488 [Anisodus acutangulus]